jgi:uncharacterized protein YwgA
MKELIVLSRILDEIDGDSFETLEGRITFQKRVYLLQAAGLDLGYLFSWDQFGPYSKELAEDGAALDASRQDTRDAAKGLRFRQEVQATLGRIKDLMLRPSGSAITQAAWLEMLSSVHFILLSKGHKVTSDEQFVAARTELLQKKPYFDKFASDLDTARQRLLGLPNIS